MAGAKKNARRAQEKKRQADKWLAEKKQAIKDAKAVGMNRTYVPTGLCHIVPVYGLVEPAM